MEKHRVVLAGYYGFGNLGDELLLHVVLDWLKGFPVTPCVLSGEPAQTQQRFGVQALSRTGPLSLVRALWGAKALIFGGGGILQDVTSRRSLAYYLNLIRLAKMMGVPVLMLGQGLGPLSDKGQHRVTQVLKQVDYIGVRDRHSHELLQQWGIQNAHRGTDLALSLSAPDTPPSETGAPLLGLALVAPPAHEHAFVINQLVYAVNQAQDEFEITPIFLACNQADLQFGIDLNRRVRSMTVLPLGQDTLESQLALFSEFNVIWGSRLHALILSTITGVPFVALGYDPKVVQFVEQINERLVHPMSHWVLSGFDEQILVETTGVLQKGYHNFEADLKEAAKILRGQARAALADAGHRLNSLLGLRGAETHDMVNEAALEQGGSG